MDPSGALLALEELAKWRERKRRVEARLGRLRARKRALLRDLEVVQRTIADLRSQVDVTPVVPVMPVDTSSTLGAIR